MTIFSTKTSERIFATLYILTMITAAALIMTLMMIFAAQNAIPHQYNNWVKDHPEYHMFALVQEPKVTIGNAGATRDIDITEYYGFFYDSEHDCWSHLLECWGTDEFIIENPPNTLEPVYLYISAVSGFQFDNPEQCTLTYADKAHMFITLNPGCAVHIQSDDPSGYIQLSLDPLD